MDKQQDKTKRAVPPGRVATPGMAPQPTPNGAFQSQVVQNPGEGRDRLTPPGPGSVPPAPGAGPHTVPYGGLGSDAERARAEESTAINSRDLSGRVVETEAARDKSAKDLEKQKAERTKTETDTKK